MNMTEFFCNSPLAAYRRARVRCTCTTLFDGTMNCFTMTTRTTSRSTKITSKTRTQVVLSRTKVFYVNSTSTRTLRRQMPPEEFVSASSGGQHRKRERQREAIKSLTERGRRHRMQRLAALIRKENYNENVTYDVSNQSQMLQESSSASRPSTFLVVLGLKRR